MITPTGEEVLNRQVMSLSGALSDTTMNWMTEQISAFLNLPKTYKTEELQRNADGTPKMDGDQPVIKEVEVPVDYQYANIKLQDAGYICIPELKDSPKGVVLTLEFYKKELERKILIKSTYEVKLEEVK